MEGSRVLGLDYFRKDIRNWGSKICPLLFGEENMEEKREKERELNTSKRDEEKGRRETEKKKLLFPFLSVLAQGYNEKRGDKF